MRDAAAGRPRAAMNHDNRRAAGRRLLNVRVEGEIAGIGDVPPDTGNDVVAVWIADLKRGAGLCECGCVDCERDEERNDLSCDEGHGRAPEPATTALPLDARRNHLEHWTLSG